MKLFDLENNTVVVYPEALLIKEFKAVWDSDKSKDKQYAKEDLAFVYFKTDYKSIYRNYDEDIRDSKIIKDIITREDWKPSKQVEEAIIKYKELHKTYSIGLLEDVEYGLSKLRHYFRNAADNLSEDLEGKFTDKYITNVKKSRELISDIKGLKEIVEKELNENKRVWGGGTVSSREVPKNRKKA